MNRSILIVIVDFLLISLLAFSNFDPPPDPPPAAAAVLPAAGTGREDMVSALKTALDDERQSRERLAAELARSQNSLEAQQNLLAEREQRIQQAQENLQRAEKQAKELNQQRSALQQQIAASRAHLETLQNTLSATRDETKLTREQLEKLQSDVRQRQAESESLRHKLVDLERSHSHVVAEKQQLNTKLQVAEAEKKIIAGKVTEMQNEVQIVRSEKAQLQVQTAKLAEGHVKLAEGFTALAEKSGALTQEIREHRPQTANTLYVEFTQNRLEAQFESTHGGLLGREVKSEKKAQTILVGDGTNTFALFHVSDTPLTFWPPGQDWHSLSGTLARGLFSYPISRVSFLAQDPRVVVVPLRLEEVQRLGGKVYRLAPDPFKFQEAILVGATEQYFGESRFQIDPQTPQYVKMDRSLVRGLMGKFNPTRGDLVLSKTGEVLGIMVNHEYCAVLGPLAVGASLQTGDNLRLQRASQTLEEYSKRVAALPERLR